MTKNKSTIELFTSKMRAENLPEIFIKNFTRYYRKLQQGSTGLIAEKDILPVHSLPDALEVTPQFYELGKQHISRTVFLKLNGGLGTSMGLEKAKSLLHVKDGLTFLDIITRQTEKGGFKLIFMHSFSTQADCLQYLQEKYPQLGQNMPIDFLQHKQPKISQENLTPISWPQNPELEWCPPGHGDLYISIYTSGVLDSLLEQGYQYAFISNADNLGAVLDPAILGYFVHHKYAFMMEVTERTEADKKGGHLAKDPNGRLILREVAQCPEADRLTFQDIQRHRYFNTNNLWIDLIFLKKLLKRKRFYLGLPMIKNQKTVDPRDPATPKVYHLETAVGSAISVFEGAAAINVHRWRFAPVKNTNDLLAVRSDLYQLDNNFQIKPIPHRIDSLPEIDLDPQYYQKIDDFEKHFPDGAPSLRDCEKLQIVGDFYFGKNVICKGRVTLRNSRRSPVKIPDGQIIQGDLIF